MMNSAAPHLPNLRELISSARHQHRAGAGTVLDVLLRGAGASSAELLARIHTHTGVRALSNEQAMQPDFSALDLNTAQEWKCVVLQPRSTGGQDSATLALLAAADPWDETLVQRVARRVGRQLPPVAVVGPVLEQWLGSVAGAAPPTSLASGTDLGSGGSASRSSSGSASTVDLPEAAVRAEGPVVGFVDTAICAGFHAGSSDIHFECDRAGVSVKHRVDGVMAHFARLEGAQSAQEVISRIKVMAQLDITERRLPQDGRVRFQSADVYIDLRVSIMPSVFGEDAVLRLLDKAQLRSRKSPASLDLLGFEAHSAALIRELANEPSGMLLVTGPTGSGKTTTVYAVLTEINTGLEKIITIEDPVEYELPGVLQIPVNERKGLTFAKGLRSILRHDPDRILVGEIRDAETAEIAVQSALTGHLVFTTVHANGVADIMGRFRHFGLDMFGFMSSLNGVVVQRLVRQLCPACTGQRRPNDRERGWLQQALAAPQLSDVPATVPQAVGCKCCHGSGYRGRFVLAEVHVIDDALRDHVTEGSPVSVLKQHVYAKGVETLAAQAARHVLAGHTTLEEVKRVVGWL